MSEDVLIWSAIGRAVSRVLLRKGASRGIRKLPRALKALTTKSGRKKLTRESFKTYTRKNWKSLLRDMDPVVGAGLVAAYDYRTRPKKYYTRSVSAAKSTIVRYAGYRTTWKWRRRKPRMRRRGYRRR